MLFGYNLQDVVVPKNEILHNIVERRVGRSEACLLFSRPSSLRCFFSNLFSLLG